MNINKKKLTLNITSEMSLPSIKQLASIETGMLQNDFFLMYKGKILNENTVQNDIIYIVPRLLGGKGGFGSMLRAIGAQIEKTTNREACRDLSGRRLRDINEEKRVKDFLAKGGPSTDDPEERKKRKLQRLCQAPKTEFKDEHYEKQMSEMTESVSDAIECGFKAGTSEIPIKKKIKSKVYFDSDLDTDSSCDELDEENVSTESTKKEQSDKELKETENVNKRKSLDLENSDTITIKKIKA
ncbi:LOW QUALITY PROTEIN: splicing regulator SDE2 [Rhopalosiphum padi]|uniref:LOW QUALITY PROTEIN: splicing regulator SDE2 n=1 Tax=Rhopalosiphum padi TaxID=40932 RepID=UPI00298D9031|nr:LOW QUALITY PROTEIN: splicing regulator SDE2 [Rhopalosiphum padi]